MLEKKNSKLKFGAVLFLCSGVAIAGYTGWQNEATVTADTVALFSYDSDTIQWTYAAMNEVGDGTYDWIYDPAAFVESGKFGDGGMSTGLAASTYASSASYTLWPNSTSISVEMWVNFNAVDHETQYLTSKEGAPGTGFAMYTSHSSEMASNENQLIWTVGSAYVDSGTLTWVTGQWYHVAGTWDDSTKTAYLYRDGQLLNKDVIQTSMVLTDSGQTFAIGSNNQSSYSGADAILDDFKMSSTAYQYVPEPASISFFAIAVMVLMKRKSKTESDL